MQLITQLFGDLSLAKMLLLLGSLASFILTTLIGIFFKESFYLLIAKVLNAFGVKKERGLNGLWRGGYLYRSAGQTMVERHVLQLRQVGCYVIGHDIESEAHGNKIFGHLDDHSVFTGTWKNQEQGHNYSGAFQFVLDNAGTKLHGQWIGFGSKNDVNNGPWHLELLNRKISRAAKNEAKQIKAQDKGVPIQWMDKRPIFEHLLAIYREAWQTKNPHKILEVFCPDATYHERLFDEPIRNHDGIKDYWMTKVVGTQDHINFTLKTLYVFGAVGIAEWEVYFDRLDQNIRQRMIEIAVMTLKDDKIHEFREYWHSKKEKDLVGAQPTLRGDGVVGKDQIVASPK